MLGDMACISFLNMGSFLTILLWNAGGEFKLVKCFFLVCFKSLMPFFGDSRLLLLLLLFELSLFVNWLFMFNIFRFILLLLINVSNVDTVLFKDTSLRFRGVLRCKG